MHDTSGDTDRAVHGALDYAELARLGLKPEEVLDFSVNANPYGPSPRVREALTSVVIERYPDRESLQLRQSILDCEVTSTHLSLSSLLCGNGTSELIWTIARTYLQPGDKAAILGPTFGEYAAACRAAGATLIETRAQAEMSFQPAIADLSACICSEQPRIVWLCNPNNPTGIWLARSQMLHIVEACKYAGALLVIDEAYQKFLVPAETYSAVELLETAPDARIIVLRALTKDYALAAARLGYLVSSADSVALLTRQLPSWNVSGFAQAAGIAALSDQDHLKATLQRLAVERDAFFQALEQTGLPIIPSRTHFCLLRVGNAHHVRQQLLERKILVRDCTSFGLLHYIRVATRPASEWRQLVRALQEVVCEQRH